MDKVIIDGVDVSGCEHYSAEIETKMPYGEYEIQKDKCHYSGIEVIQNCKGNKGCIYKQLQRLEQENERLKDKLLCESVKCGYVYSFTSQPEINRIGYLERENKKLVNDLNKFGNLNNKYKQALQEIREIAEKMYNTNDEDVERDFYIKLQDKINEVIGAE